MGQQENSAAFKSSHVAEHVLRQMERRGESRNSYLLLGRDLLIAVHYPVRGFTFPRSWFWEFCSSGLLLYVKGKITFHDIEKESSVCIFQGRYVVEELRTLKDGGAIVPFV